MDLRTGKNQGSGGGGQPPRDDRPSAPVPVPAPAARTSETTPRQSGKRPMRSLTAEEKVSAIDRVHNGESKAAVARDMGVPESTLRGWCKSEEKLRSQARNSGNFERSSPIGSESDRSTASQTPPSDTPLTAPGMSTRRELSRDDNALPAVKRPRFDSSVTSSVADMNLMGTSGSVSSRVPYFNGDFRSLSSYHQMFSGLSNISELSNTAVQQQIHNQATILRKQATILQSLFPNFSNISGLSGENGMQNFSNQMTSTALAASIITNNIAVNGINGTNITKNKRKNNHSTQMLQSSSKASTYKHRLSPDAEKPGPSGSRGASPIASTSTTNGSSSEPTPVKPAKETKGLNDIVRSLMQAQQQHQQQQQQQQQQQSGYTNDVLNLYTLLPQVPSYERSMLDNVIGNNNNIYNTSENGYIMDLPESQQSNLEEAIRDGERLLNFLDRHGQPVFTFAQVDMVRNIIFKLRELKDKNEFKKNEVSTS